LLVLSIFSSISGRTNLTKIILRAFANNELHGGATPSGNLFTVSARIVSRGAVYVTSITIALDLGSVRVEQSKAITTS
jgi:hypothetical protein